MLQRRAAEAVSYLLTAWFITSFVLIVAAGVFFIGSVAFYTLF